MPSSKSKPAKSKAKYKSLTLEEKFSIINEVKKGVKAQSLSAKENAIPLSTLSTFSKNQDKIAEALNGLKKTVKNSIL